MAELVTQKKLVDAGVDVDTLGEYANIDKVVTARLGLQYPSAPMTSRLILESGLVGGAAIFNTFAQMQAQVAVLAEDAYAYVIDDSIDTNGYYQKRSGVWVYLGANYSKPQRHNALTEGAQIVGIKPLEKAHYFSNGGRQDSVYSTTSESIPVSKGDCYVMTGLQPSSVNRSLMSYFDDDGNFLSTIVGGRIKKANSSVVAILPKDGFMRVTTYDEKVVTGIAAQGAALYKTDINGIALAVDNDIRPNLLKSLEGYLFTALVDKQVVADGKSAFGGADNVGAPINYLVETDDYVYERVPVKAGQYLHIHSNPTYSRLRCLVFENEAGRFLATSDILSTTSLRVDWGMSYCAINILCPVDGYARITSGASRAESPVFIGVTDGKIAYERDYLKDSQSIDFLPNLSNSYVRTFKEIWNTIDVNGLASSSTRTDADYTVSKPYLLKKGEVLEYELESAIIPAFALVLPSDKQMLGTLASYEKGIVLSASDIVTMAQGQAWVSGGRYYDENYYAMGKRAKIAFCDEDRDSVIIFMRPTRLSTRFNEYKLSEAYSVRVHSIADYKKIRNKEIVNRFKSISKISINHNNNTLDIESISLTSGSYPPVLMFKGEVLGYLTNFTGLGAWQRLDDATGVEPCRQSTLPTYFNRELTPEYSALPLKKDVRLSHRFAQVLCEKTCIFTPFINYSNPEQNGNLDADNMIADSYYPPRIIDFKDMVIGENIMPTLTAAFISYLSRSEADILDINSAATLSNDTLVSFAPKGSAIEVSSWNDYSGIVMRKAINPNFNMNNTAFEPVGAVDDKGVSQLMFGQLAQYKTGIEVDETSLYLVSTGTAVRDVYTNASLVDPLNPYMVDSFEFGIKTIPNYRYDERYRVTSDTRITIPETTGLSFNFCTPNSISLDVGIWSKMQILQNGKVLAVFNTLTKNQGQSTANSIRKNVNIELYNDQYQEVSIQFGDYLEQSEFVLKSYLDFDKGHFKDISSSDFYYALRNAEPYPIGGVLPKAIYDDLSQPSNIKARGTPFGFPVELHRGGKFASLATLRCKKKRANYGMIKGNKNHILMEADWLIKGEVLSWSTADASVFEVREPSMKGYSGGDVVFPAGFEGVQTSVERFLDWARSCYNGTTDIRATYADYIHLDAFLDFWLAIMVSGNADGTRNNFLLGTHGGGIWRVYWYDSDATWGIQGAGVKVSTSWEDTNSFFKVLATTMLPELKARYAMHRRAGTINIKRLQDHMEELRSTIHMDSAKLDVKYWGALNPASGLPWSKEWTAGRINYLDTKYGFTV